MIILTRPEIRSDCEWATSSSTIKLPLLLDDQALIAYMNIQNMQILRPYYQITIKGCKRSEMVNKSQIQR